MLDSELSMRILSSEAKVDSKRLRTKTFWILTFEVLAPRFKSSPISPIYINDNGNTTAPDILSQCRKIKSECLGLIIIDYPPADEKSYWKPFSRAADRRNSRGLKSMAKNFSVL